LQLTEKVKLIQEVEKGERKKSEVSSDTIANSFAKCGFKIDTCLDTVSETDDNIDQEDSSRWSTIAAYFGVPDMTFAKYINVSYETPTEEEIMQTVMGTEEEEDDDSDDCDSEAAPPPSPSPLPNYAMLGLDVVRRYLECSLKVDPEISTYLNLVSNAITRKRISQNLHQTMVDNYFTIF